MLVFNPGRQVLAEALGFTSATPNSIDAVSDRDFAVEFLFFVALCGVHLSRLAEAVILFPSAEFGFFEVSDPFSTGSSLMPQKRNPDVFELARGKSGALLGYLVGLSRQRVNEALQTLQAGALIRIEYGGVRVLDLEGLRRFGRN